MELCIRVELLLGSWQVHARTWHCQVCASAAWASASLGRFSFLCFIATSGINAWNTFACHEITMCTFVSTYSGKCCSMNTVSHCTVCKENSLFRLSTTHSLTALLEIPCCILIWFFSFKVILQLATLQLWPRCKDSACSIYKHEIQTEKPTCTTKMIVHAVAKSVLHVTESSWVINVHLKH